MTTRFHGLTSLGLVGCALILALVILFQESIVLGIVYLGVCTAGMVVVLYAFCARCPCKKHCGHVLPGQIAGRFHRRPGPYTPTDFAATAIALLILLGLPQFWLWQHPGVAVVFWVLTGIGLVQIRTYICRACTNVFCPLHARYGAAGRSG